MWPRQHEWSRQHAQGAEAVQCASARPYCVLMHNAQQDIYTNLCIGSLGRAPSPTSLSASFIFPAFARLFLPPVGLSLSFLCAQQPSCFSCLGRDGFRALCMELFRIYMFTTSSKTTTIKACVRVPNQTTRVVSLCGARTRALMYDTYIYVQPWPNSQI